MDYNENDYEGHNLHLTGEESSKISSVLRPFALPKFDFDDSLPGHLRFDSLVENEVFLGIPNQEDNQWIEDYSRGGNGIEFSSSAAVSCALPRHVNVWSEATSSESVEMLLKAVGQEEMVQGENIEESDLGNQLAGSTGQTENNSRQDDMIEDVDHQNSSLPPTGVEEIISRTNQSAGLEGANTEYTLEVEEMKFPSYEVSIDGKDISLTTTENSSADMKELCDKPGDTCDFVNESMPNEVQGNLPLLGTEIPFTDSSSQYNVVSVKEVVDQDKISNISSVSASTMSESISVSVKEQGEGFKENDERLKGIAVETDNRASAFPHEDPSTMESSKGEHAAEIDVANFEEVSDVPGRGKSVDTDGFNEVAFDDEPAGGSQHGTAVLSSGTETKNLYEGCCILNEKPFVSIEGEVNEGIGISGSDVVTPIIDVKTKLKPPLIQPSDQHRSLGGNKDSFQGSLEASHSTVESSVLLAALGDPSERDHEKSSNPDGDLGDLKDIAIAGKRRGEKSMVDDTRNDSDSSLSQKEILEDVNHLPSPLAAGSLQTSKEDNISKQVDDQENDKKLPLDSSNIVQDDKEVGSASSGGENTGTIIGSQPNSSAGDYAVLNTEGKDIQTASSLIKDVDLVGCHECTSPSHDEGCVIQSKETESDVLKQPSASVSEEILKSTEIHPAVAIEKELDSAVEETRMSDQSISLVETPSVAMPDDACKELNKTLGLSADASMVQDAGAEAAPTEKQTQSEKEKGHGTSSSTLSAATCTVELDRSNQAADPGTSCSDLSQNDVNKGASLEKSYTKSSGEVLTESKTSGSKELGTFTFEIRPQGGQSTGYSPVGLQSFPRIQACKLALAGEGPPSSSGSSQTDAVVVTESSHVPSLTAGVFTPSGGPTDRKARHSSSKSGRGRSKKGNQVKETTPPRHAEKGGKSSQLLSPLGAGQLMAFESVLKPRGAASITTCSLPDLNTSTPSSAFFQQPFTDLQQVQLRAQIFVYGSLIQGVVPDEACMVSAFGASDGSRSIWEPSWRACVERFQSQKVQGNISETPLPSRPGVKASDQTSRQNSHEGEAVSSTTSRAGTKATLSPIVNAMMPLSSPLWSMATASCEALPLSSMAKTTGFDYQAVSALNPGQMPSIRNYITNSSGPLQASFPVPWLPSSLSSPFDISSSYPSFTIMEPVKSTPARETSLAVTSGTKHLSAIPVTSGFTGTPPLESKKAKASTGQASDIKSRKRKKTSGADVLQIPLTASLVDTQSPPLVTSQLSKKTPAVEGLNQVSLIGHNQATMIPKPVIGSHYTASVAVATPSSLTSKNTTNQFYSVVQPSVTTDRVNKVDSNIDKVTMNIEGLSKAKEVKSQAEEAAAHAAAAINHCEGVWSQLDQQKNSGLTSETESKLASAVVAIEAAASVAKAAAAAAKIASRAALEAKQMADEVIAKSGALNTTDYDAILVSNAMKLASAPPLSILQGGNWNNASSLVISAAREAARKKIETASAATRHAENIDAIIKAAELAAEAVSNAGKIVTMGDHLSLSELAMAGPNNYWKGLQVTSIPGSKPEDLNKNKSIHSNVGKVSNVYMSQHGKSDVNMHVTSHVVSPIERESARNLEPDHVTVGDDLMASMKNGEKGSKPQKEKMASNGSKISSIVSDPDTAPSIKEGSHVEVLKNRGDLMAWFTATVLCMKDTEALVCYTQLKSDEGSELLKEWISLEAKDGNAPKIRIPHPMTALQFEGTRKRRRAAVKDYTWSVGDRVDAWVQDCWCEGIVAEKNTKDAMALSIHFPDIRETLMIKVWQLRPTLIWSDGQWTEWCRPERDGTSQGDTPDEKRAKLGGIGIETKGEAKMAKGLTFDETGKNEKSRLPLSADEKVFSIGSTRAQKKPSTARTKRPGSEKEAGSRVVIGVPKPGKRRKFMEVSKHYVSEGSSKGNAPGDSMKLAKASTAQGSGAWGTKNKSKPDVKEKQVVESKTRAPKSGKPPSIPSRTAPKRDGAASLQPNEYDATVSDQALMGSTSNDGNESDGQNLAECGSFSNVEVTSGDTMPSSSQDLPLENRKKVRTKNAKSEQANQGKPSSTSEESAKEEANEALNSEAAEPRRSNRRIQPTSRLLEGLQSSIVIPKFPSSSHDKGPRSHKRRPNRRE